MVPFEIWQKDKSNLRVWIFENDPICLGFLFQDVVNPLQEKTKHVFIAFSIIKHSQTKSILFVTQQQIWAQDYLITEHGQEVLSSMVGHDPKHSQVYNILLEYKINK